MKALLIMSLLLPMISQAKICSGENPKMNQYLNQTTWKTHRVSQPGVSLSLDGYLDKDNNFFPEEVFTKTVQTSIVKPDPSNEDYKGFLKFCAKYDNTSAFVLTSFRKAEAMNRYQLKTQYLPDTKQFSNDPYQLIKTNQFKVSIELSPDSIISQQNFPEELKSQIEDAILTQLKPNSPIGSYEITLTNWDDFACDLIQGKAKINIVREMYSEDLFIEREERIQNKDAQQIYSSWSESLKGKLSSDELFFKAGIVFESLKQQNKIAQVQNDVALEFIRKVVSPDQTGVKLMKFTQLQCTTESLQKYEAEYTQFQINVQFAVDKTSSLMAGE